MTTISFPSSPTVGQIYTYMDRQWIWNGTGWAWYLNLGQVSLSFRLTASTVVTINELANSDLSASAWLHKVYV